MNELSWLIYLAGALNNVGVLFGLVAIITGLTAGFLTLARAIERDQFSPPNGLLILCAVAALVASVVPDRNTIYAIAASEMGEKMLETPVANKATKALEAWLDKQIADATSEDDANEDK